MEELKMESKELKENNIDNKYVIEYCSDDRIIAREYELV